VPGDVTEYFLEGRSGGVPAEYRPMVMGLAKLHFVDAKLGLDQWDTTSWLAPLGDDGKSVDWAAGSAHPDLKARLSKSPASGAAFADLPGAAMRAANYTAWGKSLTAHLYEQARAEVLFCDALKLASAPGEDEAQFRVRMAQSLREKRDEAVEALRRKYAPKLATLQDRVARAEDKVQREQAQLSQQKMNTAVSVGAGILGALFGRKTLSAGTIGRAGSAARSASRIGRESQDVERAGESLETVRQRLADLQAESEAEIATLTASFEGDAVELRKVSVTPRKSDIAVGQVALVWTPWRKDADGFPVTDA
jgi:Skp family chaperone for outer membrane proteins